MPSTMEFKTTICEKYLHLFNPNFKKQSFWSPFHDKQVMCEQYTITFSKAGPGKMPLTSVRNVKKIAFENKFN